jgi:Protein kinase domain
MSWKQVAPSPSRRRKDSLESLPLSSSSKPLVQEDEEDVEAEVEQQKEKEMMEKEKEKAESERVAKERDRVQRLLRRNVVHVSDLEMGQVIGDGAFATVRKAWRKKEKKEKNTVDDSDDEDVYAVKILDKRSVMDEGEAQSVYREKTLLSKLRHPNVVKLFSTGQDAENLYFVLEYCKHGDMFSHLKRLGSFDETCSRFYIAELISTLDYLHSLGIVHRDVKPESMCRHCRLNLAWPTPTTNSLSLFLCFKTCCWPTIFTCV